MVFLGGSHEDKAVPTARAWNKAGGWSELPQLPEPRTKAQAIALADGRVAVIGGYRTQTQAAAGSSEMDGSEYRPENRWYTAEVMLPTLAIGSPRTGWTTRESPRLGTPRLFRMANGGIVCVQDEDAQILASIWETPVA